MHLPLQSRFKAFCGSIDEIVDFVQHCFGQILPPKATQLKQKRGYHCTIPFNSIFSFKTLYLQSTPKWLLWQTVKIQVKFRIMRHFIRVYTVL